MPGPRYKGTEGTFFRAYFASSRFLTYVLYAPAFNLAMPKEVFFPMYDSKTQVSPEPKVSKQGRPDRVLLVDDETASVEALDIQLRLQGFEVVLVTTGREALDIARSWHPDAIVLDLCLPDISGLEICQELAANIGTADIPVIILSGMEGADIVRRCRAAGGMYYIAKPYDPNVLLLLISEAVAEHRLWHETTVQDDQ